VEGAGTDCSDRTARSPACPLGFLKNPQLPTRSRVASPSAATFEEGDLPSACSPQPMGTNQKVSNTSITERELEELVQEHLTTSAFCRTMSRRGDPASFIIAVAEELKVDLIVMPTHGHMGIDRMILGSVAERVAREARRLVLTIRLS
jgi:nucleotide-binding universal stress UspA family protein